MAYTGKKIALSIEELRVRFQYDPETGKILIIKAMKGKRGRVGQEAGCILPNGYRYVGFNGRRLLASRVAWALHYNFWPKNEIDHIDGNPLNNRITNLRDVHSGAQKRNRRPYGATGVKSVVFHQKGYRARLTVDYKIINVGCFSNLFDAEQAVIAKEKELGIYQYRRGA